MDIGPWLIELAKATGKVFLNPMLYWAFILLLLVGSKRIKREREQFGFKVFPLFSELRNTWLPALMIGLLISILFIGVGVVFPNPTVLLLSMIVILLSINGRLTLLSTSYTIGLTYLIILISPVLLKYQTVIDVDIFNDTSLTSLTILLGIFLLVEAFLLKRVTRNDTFPQLVKSHRGGWIGQQQLKRLSIIPFFVLVPNGLITSFAPFWPYFSIGGETYSLLLIPFILGFDFPIRRHLPGHVANRLGNSISLLGFLVILIAIGSMYVSWLSFIAIVISILGREYIVYKHKVADDQKSSYFTELSEGLKVLGIIPQTPGDHLNILVGETITKVNGIPINNVGEFYEALQASGAYFKLDVIDDAGEVRFVQGPFYAGDHHKLGLIFTEQPYYEKRLAK